MLIDEQKLEHWLENFYGYGSWNAPIWFIAYEEGGGDLPEEVAEKFNYFQDHYPSQDQPTLCDVRELYREVIFRADGEKTERFTTMYEYRFGDNAILHGVWKNLICFTAGYRNEDLPDLLSWQKHFFLSPSQNREALLQLYPLPSPHNHAWYYSWLDMPRFSFLKSRVLYERHVYENRIRNIVDKIRLHKPEVVVMYGMNNINALKLSFQESFPETRFKMIKAVKQQIPQHHRTNINGTSLLITTQIPALRHNRIETGFDWYELGKTVK